MTTVLDASAILAFLGNKPGADVVEHALEEGAVVSAVNWSEVIQKVRATGRDWSTPAALLSSYGLDVVAANAEDGEHAAALWRRGSGLSLADRFCLALGDRLALPILTADAAWGTDGRIRQIR